MEAYDFLDEGLVVVREPLPVLLQVEYGPALRFYFIDVQVVDPSDLVAGLRSLYVLLLLDVALLRLLLGHSDLILDAEVVVSLMRRVELFQIFAFQFAELETLLLYLHSLRGELVHKLILKPQDRNGEVSAQLVPSCISQL